MNTLIWIVLFILILIVAKYYFNIWSAGRKVIKKISKKGSGELARLKILFGNKVVPEGAAIPHNIAIGIPTIKYADAKEKSYYTLVMVDPDAPSHSAPAFREWRHWVVGNIPGKKLIHGFSGDASTVTSYSGPMPPEGSGYHRYYFKLYEQPRQMTFEQLSGDRKNWKSRKFAKTKNLHKVVQTHFLTRRREKNTNENISVETKPAKKFFFKYGKSSKK